MPGGHAVPAIIEALDIMEDASRLSARSDNALFTVGLRATTRQKRAGSVWPTSVVE